MQLSSGVVAFSGDLRHPQLRVLANGVLVVGAVEAEVRSNNHYAADQFAVAIALSADPTRQAAWWASQDDLLIDIEVSLGGAFQSLVRGAVDSIEIEPLRNVLRIQGRDLSAGLIEARTQETFANRTSSEIAEILASRHGLSIDAQATTTPVGRYWQLEHDRIVLGGFARATTEWDLLVSLAQHEAFDVWVSGATLHFRAPNPPVSPILLRVDDLISLRIERSLTLSRDIEVTVKSWHSRTAHSYVQSARRRLAGHSRERVQRYVYIVPNLTPDEALRLAQLRLAELTRHERLLVAQMPGELTLAPRKQICLQGTGTQFDRVYWLDGVERRFDQSDGFTQCLHARNSDSGAQATTPADKVMAVWTGS